MTRRRPAEQGSALAVRARRDELLRARDVDAKVVEVLAEVVSDAEVHDVPLSFAFGDGKPVWIANRGELILRNVDGDMHVFYRYGHETRPVGIVRFDDVPGRTEIPITAALRGTVRIG